MDNEKRQQQFERIKQQLDVVKDIIDTAEYSKCTDIQVYTSSSTMVVDYVTTKGWTVHANVHNDNTVYFEFSKRVDKDGYSKTVIYEINVMRYDHLNVLEHWITWYWYDDNGEKIVREVLITE